MRIIYEDASICVCEKPVGVASQNERGFAEDMVSLLMTHRRKQKDDDCYIGVVHRLDKMVGGIMVYAKTRQAAAELSKQAANHQMSKHYYAVVKGRPKPDSGTYEDYLMKDGKLNVSKVADKNQKDAKRAVLKYEVLGTVGLLEEENNLQEYSLVKIELLTGRHHQIRVQFSSRGFPLMGDRKYNSETVQTRYKGVALYSCSLGFMHPRTKKYMEFSAKPTEDWFSEFQIFLK